MTSQAAKIWKILKKDRNNPKIMVEKIRNFGRENGNFVLKNVIQKSCSSKFSPPPAKLGARSPPMVPRSTIYMYLPIITLLPVWLIIAGRTDTVMTKTADAKIDLTKTIILLTFRFLGIDNSFAAPFYILLINEIQPDPKTIPGIFSAYCNIRLY